MLPKHSRRYGNWQASHAVPTISLKRADWSGVRLRAEGATGSLLLSQGRCCCWAEWSGNEVPHSKSWASLQRPSRPTPAALRHLLVVFVDVIQPFIYSFVHLFVREGRFRLLLLFFSFFCCCCQLQQQRRGKQKGTH